MIDKKKERKKKRRGILHFPEIQKWSLNNEWSLVSNPRYPFFKGSYLSKRDTVGISQVLPTRQYLLKFALVYQLWETQWEPDTLTMIFEKLINHCSMPNDHSSDLLDVLKT